MQPRAFVFHAGVSWHRFLPSWPLIIGFLGFAEAIATPPLLQDPDTYLHVAAGRWMVAHLALPTADPFSHTMPGAAWVPHEWLAELAMGAGYDFGGWGAVALVTALCFALAMAIFARLLLRCFEPFSLLMIAIGAGWLLLPHVLARPHVLALPLLVLWCGILIDARDGGRPPPLWLLPVMTVWANLHGGFMFGLALAGFLGGEAVLQPGAGQTRTAEVRRWSLFLVLAAGAAFLTPNGLAGFLQPFRLVGMPSLQTAIIEWQSPALGDFPMLEFWVLGALALGFSFGFRLPATRLVLALGMFHLALQHIRHADLLALVVPLGVAAPLGAQIRDRLRAVPTSALTRQIERLAEPAAMPALVMAMASMLVVGSIVVSRPINRAGDPATPSAALAAARALGASGPVFNTHRYGGYLIFEGVPVLIDGRLEMYGDAFFARYLKASGGGENALADMLDEFHIGWTMLQPHDGAVAVLDRLPGWRRAYADTQAVIHIRSRPAP
ncbi:MAG: hypothetical protein JO204_10580 [Alphaproteobacteria bacterium]|nr:hypothetical protein [Alphaproteobacteria bacterium]